MTITLPRPWMECLVLALCLGGLAGGCDGSKAAISPHEAGVTVDTRTSDSGRAEVVLADAAGVDLARHDTFGDLLAGDAARSDTQAADTNGLDISQPEGDLDAQVIDTPHVETSGVEAGQDASMNLDGGSDVPMIASDAGDAFVPLDGGGVGADGSGDPAACSGSGGPSMVRLPEGYCIDRTEVTRGQYEAWLATNPATAGQESRCAWNASFTPPAWCLAVACQGSECGGHPQTCVDWCDAYAYCKAVGKRLCGDRAGGAVDFLGGYADATQSQWLNACTSGGIHAFPYGDAYDKTRCSGSDSGLTTTVPVGSLAGCQSAVAAYSGVFDLSGNVVEWEDACNGDTGAADKCRLRGGSYNTYYLGMDCDQDFSLRRNSITQAQGIRCCSQ